MERLLTPERLDDPTQPEARLVHSLGQVSQANRWLGGDRSLRAALADLEPSDRELTLLDVGVGDGSTLRRTVDWLGERGVGIHAVGLDLNPLVCRACRSTNPDPDARFVAGNARNLPFADRSFDFALATLTLHHFSASDALGVLRQMARVVRTRIVVSELERSLVHYLGSQVLAHTVWGNNSITRHDAPVSVRAGFTTGELRTLGEQAGLTEIRILRHIPFRVTLTGRPT